MPLKFYLSIAAVLSILAVAGYIYHKGGSDREASIINDAVKEKLEEREVLDEIRNRPIGIDDVTDRLREGSF